MKRPEMLVLIAIAEIVFGACGWYCSAKIQGFPETPATIVEHKVDEVEGKPYQLVKYAFLVDGKVYEGDYIHKLLKDRPVQYAEQNLDHLIGRNGILTVRYEPENPENSTLRIPSSWPAKLAVALGIYNLLLFVWAVSNASRFRIGEEENWQKINTGLPKFLKNMFAGASAIALFIAYSASPLFETDAGVIMMEGFRGLCFFVPCAFAVCYSAYIISNMPLFCRLAGVEREIGDSSRTANGKSKSNRQKS